jgi:hypothetical protein
MNQGKIPLVEGESPLDKLLEILGMTQLEFCIQVGLNPSTPSRWKGVGGKPPTETSLTLRQCKNFSALLAKNNLDWTDLPDSFAPYEGKSV